MPGQVDEVADRGAILLRSHLRSNIGLMLSGDAEAVERPIEASKTAPADERRGCHRLTSSVSSAGKG